MAKDQELIGLENDLLSNLNSQENIKAEIAELEGYLSSLENEQSAIERDILELQGISENAQGNEESFNIILSGIASDMLQGINVELDQNEEGEMIH